MAATRHFNYNRNKKIRNNKQEIKRRPSCSSTIANDKEMCKNEECIEDRRLLTWNKWSENRKKDCYYLSKKIIREPVDLVMNLVETVREDKEQKTAIEHAQVEKKASIRNGCLWERPPRLKQPCPCKPVYEIQRTAAEIGRPRKIEHVGVPKLVSTKEKGITGITKRPKCDNLDFEFNEYRRLREKELKNNIHKILPFKPTVDDLLVIGNKPKYTQNKTRKVPSILIDNVLEPVREDLSGVYAIKINDSIFYKEQVGQDLKHIKSTKALSKVNCSKWAYYFKVPVRKVGRSKLILQNIGTVSLRFCWKKIENTIRFITKDICEQVFFFNKNEDIISPGQSKDMLLSFLCEEPGLYSECWELNFCNINFFESSSEMFIVELNGDVTEDTESINKQVKDIKRSIKQKAKLNIVYNIINEIIIKSTTVEPQLYPYKNFLLEADMFVMKNPICFYHQTEVNKLTTLFIDMQPNQDWDLSLGSWRKIMMSKDFNTRMMLYKSLKQSYLELLKPWTEGDELSVRKHRAVQELLFQLADEFDKSFDDVTVKLITRANEDKREKPPTRLDVLLSQSIHVIFYMKMRDHISSTIEDCAGILSSLDQSREIDFDFCRQ